MASTNIVTGEVIRSELKNFYEKPVTRVSVELVFSLLTVIFFALFALRPTLNTMSKLVKEIEDKEKVDEALTKKIAALTTAQSEYLSYKERFSIVESAVHTDLKLDDTLYYLEYLAAKQGISLTNLRIREFPVGSIGGADPASVGEGAGASAKDYTIGVYAINLSFSGPYQNVLSFFRELESTRPLFAVQGFALSTRRDQGTSYQLNATTTVFTYGYLDSSSAKKPTMERVKEEEPAL